MSPGDYTQKLQWQKRILTKNTTNGQDEETFFDNGKLWCSVEYITGLEQTAYGGEQTGAQVEIRVHNYPALHARDRLYSGQWGERYIIDSIRRGDNELIVDAHLWDNLELQ